LNAIPQPNSAHSSTLPITTTGLAVVDTIHSKIKTLHYTKTTTHNTTPHSVVELARPPRDFLGFISYVQGSCGYKAFKHMFINEPSDIKLQSSLSSSSNQLLYAVLRNLSISPYNLFHRHVTVSLVFAGPAREIVSFLPSTTLAR
jgi:hypothetical protein